MKPRSELAFYVSVGAGMALATSSFTVVSGLFQQIPARWVLVAVVLAGLVCWAISLSIAELAGMYPSAPGIRTFLKTALGPTTSLLFVYMYLVFTVLMAGVEGFMFASVVKSVFPNIGLGTTVAVLMGLVMVINFAGLELPRGTQIAITYLTVVVLLAVSAYGLWQTPAPGVVQQVLANGGEGSGILGLGSAVGTAIFLYMGFEWLTPVGLRPQSYERLIPRSLPLCILLLGVLYVAFAGAAAARLPQEQIAGSVVPHVVYLTTVLKGAGGYAALVLSFGAVFSTFNAGIMGGSRLIFMLAGEGNLPAWCASMSSKGVPVGAVGLLGSLSMMAGLAVVVFQLQLVWAVISACIMCVVYGAFMLSVVVLRGKKPQMRRPYRTPVPIWFQWGLVALMPWLGLGALVSLPGMIAQPLLWMAILIAVSAGLTMWSTVRTRAAVTKAEPGT